MAGEPFDVFLRARISDLMITIQSPPHASGLILLFHGVGRDETDLLPLGKLLARTQPRAWIISVRAPFAAHASRGFQWFSTEGITEENRPQRVHEALPLFERTVERYVAEAGVGQALTTLIGFSQGAILSLEASKAANPVARKIIAIGGRYATLPENTPTAQVHLIHGDEDQVISAALAIAAFERLRCLDANVTLDLVPSLGHVVDLQVCKLVVKYVRSDQSSS
jgi:phospholipase/carboxylesterase